MLRQVATVSAIGSQILKACKLIRPIGYHHSTYSVRRIGLQNLSNTTEGDNHPGWMPFSYPMPCNQHQLYRAQETKSTHNHSPREPKLEADRSLELFHMFDLAAPDDGEGVRGFVQEAGSRATTEDSAQRLSDGVDENRPAALFFAPTLPATFSSTAEALFSLPLRFHLPRGSVNPRYLAYAAVFPQSQCGICLMRGHSAGRTPFLRGNELVS